MKLLLKTLISILFFTSCGNVNISSQNQVEQFVVEPPPPPPPPPRPEAAPILVRVLESNNTLQIIGSRANNSTNITSLTTVYEKNFSYINAISSGRRSYKLTTIDDLNADGYLDYCLTYQEPNGQFTNKSISSLTGETLNEIKQEHGGHCTKINNQQQLVKIYEKLTINSQWQFINDPSTKVIKTFDRQSQRLIQTNEISVKQIDAQFDYLNNAEVIEDINSDGYDDILFTTHREIPNSTNIMFLTFILSGKTLNTSAPLLNFQSQTAPFLMHKIHFSRKNLTAWIDSNEKSLTVFKLTGEGAYQVATTYDAPTDMYFSQSYWGDGYHNKNLTSNSEISFNLCRGQNVFNWRDCDLATLNIQTSQLTFTNFFQYLGYNSQEHKGLFTLSRIQTEDDLIGCSTSIIDFNNNISATQIYSEKNKKILEHKVTPTGFWPTECLLIRETR